MTREPKIVHEAPSASIEEDDAEEDGEMGEVLPTLDEDEEDEVTFGASMTL